MDQPWPSRDSIAAIRFMKGCEGYRVVPCNGRPNRLDGYGFFGFWASDVPLVAALDALPELAPRLVGLHFGAEVAALRALLRYWLVPADEVAIGVVRAAVNRLPSLLGATLGNLAAVLRADDSGGHRPCAAALRKPAAPEKEPRPSMPLQHGRPTFVAGVLGRLCGLPIPLEGTRELARLRVILAGDERSEESALRHQASTAVRTLLGGEPGQVVRFRDEALDLHRVERLLERAIEVGENAPPRERSLLDLVELPFHLRREPDVEDVRELLDHHALDALA